MNYQRKPSEDSPRSFGRPFGPYEGTTHSHPARVTGARTIGQDLEDLRAPQVDLRAERQDTQVLTLRIVRPVAICGVEEAIGGLTLGPVASPVTTPVNGEGERARKPDGMPMDQGDHS